MLARHLEDTEEVREDRKGLNTYFQVVKVEKDEKLQHKFNSFDGFLQK